MKCGRKSVDVVVRDDSFLVRASENEKVFDVLVERSWMEVDESWWEKFFVMRKSMKLLAR